MDVGRFRQCTRRGRHRVDGRGGQDSAIGRYGTRNRRRHKDERDKEDGSERSHGYYVCWSVIGLGGVMRVERAERVCDEESRNRHLHILISRPLGRIMGPDTLQKADLTHPGVNESGNVASR